MDNQIVPGSRIGPVSLGMTEGDLLKYLGTPTSTLSYHDGGNLYEWAGLELSAIAYGGSVTQVITASQTCSPTRYATANGLKVGSTELEVHVRMGKEAWRRSDPLNIRYCFPDETEVDVDGPKMGGTAGKVRFIKVGGCVP